MRRSGKGGGSADREIARVARFLSQGAAAVAPCAAGKRVILHSPAGESSATAAALEAMAVRGLIERRNGAVALSAAGKAFLKRWLVANEPFQNQHQERAEAEFMTAEGAIVATVNLAESPLGQLRRRKGRDGRAFLSPAEFNAGERLRADFTRGQMTPRLGINWEPLGSAGRRAGTAADLADGAIAARMRVERALDAVGPEPSGVLIDVCCFLKGLETVEFERGWPARSAKLLLKTALAALDRHYQPRARASGKRRAILSWGAADYRPTVNGRARA
jgi:hypothetical protein